MNEPTLALLLAAAASIGVAHTAAGPDHYVPFIALSRASNWTLARTVAVTLLCGIAHVLGSVLLGLLGIAFGWSLGALGAVESGRGDIAGWLLTGFGLAYLAWGIRAALRNRTHSHLHVHADGTVHDHPHHHHGEHGHVHPETGRSSPGATAWVLFIIFVFGPCEPLIPLLMYPAAMHSAVTVALVTLVFGLATLTTMLAVVLLGVYGLRLATWRGVERFGPVLTGAALTACGLAVTLGL